LHRRDTVPWRLPRYSSALYALSQGELVAVIHIYLQTFVIDASAANGRLRVRNARVERRSTRLRLSPFRQVVRSYESAAVLSPCHAYVQ
jgi:hypothetical protein